MYVQLAFVARPRQGAGAAASGVEGQAAVQGGARRRHEGARRVRREGPRRADDGDARRHDDRRVRRRSSPTGSRPRGIRASSGRTPSCVYQPMLELLAYLRANGFKTFIVSGGGIEFMRPWTERVYGIPPEQVVGSAIKTQVRDARRQARAVPAAGDRLHRRQGRQAGRHQRAHRPPADRRVRQLRRRSRDAAMDDAWPAARASA